MNDTDRHESESLPDPSKPEILVGTDGSAASAQAVSYALDLATRTGAPVRIAHVVPTHRAVPATLEGAVKEAGQDLLTDVVRRAHLAAPSAEIRSSLLEGSRRTELVAAAATARLVVLGRSAKVSHLATGSTAIALVEGTDRPVRVVPPGWRERGKRAGVVVGLQDIDTSHRLIVHGFELAQDLGEPLVLLHCWGLPSGYEEVIAVEAAHTWNRKLAQRIEHEALGLRQKFPDVPFEIRIEHARTATALEAASRGAALVLLGRPSHHHVVARHAGLVRVMLNVSECPIEIGPEAHHPAPPLNLELESHGSLLK